MMIASGSIRLTAEAMPVPSASIARSISFSARWSPWSRAPLPDAAGQPRFLVLLHQLEEVGLVALFVLAAGLGFHRRAAGVGLHAAPPPAGALGAAALDDHVADLPGGAAAEPGLAVEDQATADAGSPEDPDQALELAPGAEVELRLGRDLDVVADPDLGSQRLLQRLRRAGSCLPSRAGSWRWRRRRSSRRRRRASRPRRPPAPPVSTPACSAASRSAAAISAATPAGPPLGRRRAARFAQDLAAGVDDRGLDLGAAEVDAAAQIRHRRSPCRSADPECCRLWNS